MASNLDLTYWPAVTTSYLLGDPGVTHVGIDYHVFSTLHPRGFLHLGSLTSNRTS